MEQQQTTMGRQDPSTVASKLVVAIAKTIPDEPNLCRELFLPDKYPLHETKAADKRLHTLMVDVVIKAAKNELGLVPERRERQLAPRWRPDRILLDNSGREVCVVEFESPNSSDTRVVEKDVYGYESWIKELVKPFPVLFIITTLPNFPYPEYRLRHTNKRNGYYNVEHIGRIGEIRENPFAYWYSFYRRWLEHRIVELPIFLANFSGDELSLAVPPWQVPMMAYMPALDDGSDWSGKWPLFPEVREKVWEIRKRYKNLLWAETDPSKLRKMLGQYWFEEKEVLTLKDDAWDKETEDDFLREAERVKIREEACRCIEKVQRNRYGKIKTA